MKSRPAATRSRPSGSVSAAASCSAERRRARRSIAGRDQGLPGLEVMQVGAAGEAGALGDSGCRHVRVAVLDQGGDRGVEQGFAGGGAALGLAAAGGSLSGGHCGPS